MSRGAQSIKQGDVTKAIKAAVAAGMDIKRIELDLSNRKIVIVAGQPAAAELGAGVNEWDGVK